MNITQLKPHLIWHYFNQLCEIPRPSKHEQALVTHILKLAHTKNLDAFTDSAGNVIIRKPASKGRENATAIVMQSHLDMVPQKTDASTHDFFTDPIEPYIDGEWVTANGTTLGADNGIGVAAILAVMLSEDIEHGPLEALLTVDEEAGMGGATNLEAGVLNARLLLNLDTEEEGELYVGCAGGIDVNIAIPVEWEAIPDHYTALRLSVKDLKGGHSGIDIHKGLGNAVKLATRIALESRHDFPDLRISRFEGGTLRNAIPRNSEITVVLPKQQQEDFEDYVNAMTLLFRSELSAANDTVTADIHPQNNQSPSKCLTNESQLQLLNALYRCPNGVIKMSSIFDGVVETSNNLATVSLNEQSCAAQCLVRSSDNTAREKACALIQSVFSEANANVITDNAYPGWQPAPASPLLTTMQNVYKNTFGKDAKIQVIHAGLECGLLGQKYPEWDMISFGPTIRGAHSPDERVHIESVQLFWTYLLAALKKLSTPK
ncbi:aminoacyl-histidine dipeptidase [Alkalimarinus alittae]|uniref:Aminoacyl-histidine dipeptidase n=1 Tax=Alkalimarinus alittae TaxID=2961619 RepID=A0ABY6N1U3_9ALTE|nr:aminoacyl-histidine dipeptidase [Alkalimarinus alittae]UZE96086.1 aminoacyl-histidine dipeptidase [Alkalimarinus alittae]